MNQFNTFKKCHKCNETKGIDCFYKNKSRGDRLSVYCKECMDIFSVSYRKKHSEKYKEYNQKYYVNNINKYKELSKKYREINKEKLKDYNQKYYIENKETIREQRKKYYQDNREILKETRRKKYRESLHKEKPNHL